MPADGVMGVYPGPVHVALLDGFLHFGLIALFLLVLLGLPDQ